MFLCAANWLIWFFNDFTVQLCQSFHWWRLRVLFLYNRMREHRPILSKQIAKSLHSGGRNFYSVRNWQIPPIIYYSSTTAQIDMSLVSSGLRNHSKFMHKFMQPFHICSYNWSSKCMAHFEQNTKHTHALDSLIEIPKCNSMAMYLCGAMMATAIIYSCIDWMLYISDALDNLMGILNCGWAHQDRALTSVVCEMKMQPETTIYRLFLVAVPVCASNQ